MRTHARTPAHLLAVTTVALSVAAAGPAGAARHPFPAHATYGNDALRPSHITVTEADDHVRTVYWRWRGEYLRQAGTEPDGHPRYRIVTSTAPDASTVSESQGYGMIVIALMAGEDPDARTIFDGLWEFFNDHRSSIDPRLMDWHVPADELPDPSGNDSAFDGDCDIAFALLLAAEQWGVGGRIDYRAEALDVISGILASEIGPDSRLPMLGDWAQPDGDPYNQYTFRTSDLMPDHFSAFAEATGDPVWEEVVAASRQAVEELQASHAPATGLLPDFAVPASDLDPSPQPAPPGFLEGPHDGHYYYNAGRTPWRLATHASLSGDAITTSQVRRMSQWIRTSTSGAPLAVQAGYELDGTPIGAYFTSFFAAPFGVAAMVDPDGQAWLDATWEAVRCRDEGYYEDTVTLLAMLVMSHNRWDPTTVGSVLRDGFESGDTSAWSAARP